MDRFKFKKLNFPSPLTGNEKNGGLEEWRSSYLHVIDKNCEGQSAPTLTLPHGGGKNCLANKLSLASREGANVLCATRTDNSSPSCLPALRSSVKRAAFTLAEVQPSPQRGEGAFVGDERAVQMRVRGSILPDKNFSPFTFHFSRKRAAFTLAEVLITLGIIGVVAAMTIPTFISNYKKHVTETKLKTAYTQISQVLEKVNYENDLMFVPPELTEIQTGSNGWGFALSEAVFNKYFAPHIKIVKDLEQSKRFNICNYEGKGCYKNPSFKCVITANNTGICFVINSINGNMGFQIITEPSKDVVIAGKEAFGVSVERDIRVSNYKMNLKSLKSWVNTDNEQLKAWCTQEQNFANGAGSDREYYCTTLIYKNGWKIPADYPIRF